MQATVPTVTREGERENRNAGERIILQNNQHTTQHSQCTSHRTQQYKLQQQRQPSSIFDPIIARIEIYCTHAHRRRTVRLHIYAARGAQFVPSWRGIIHGCTGTGHTHTPQRSARARTTCGVRTLSVEFVCSVQVVCRLLCVDSLVRRRRYGCIRARRREGGTRKRRLQESQCPVNTAGAAVVILTVGLPTAGREAGPRWRKCLPRQLPPCRTRSP